jgi:hypothetical protein
MLFSSLNIQLSCPYIMMMLKDVCPILYFMVISCCLFTGGCDGGGNMVNGESMSGKSSYDVYPESGDFEVRYYVS